MLGIQLFPCPIAKYNYFVLISSVFLSSEALKRYFQSMFEIDQKKTTGKYEVHKQAYRLQEAQPKEREVRLTEFNRFPKSTHFSYISSNYKSWEW